MGTDKPRNSRGPNSAVQLDLAAFTTKLFHALDCDGAFTGPGAVELTRMGYRAASKRFAITLLSEELFSKYDDGKSSPEKRRKAMERFKTAETMCALVNQKLECPSGQEPWWMDLDSIDSTEDLKVLGLVLKRARKHISRCLGSFPGWSAVFDNANFGPGATTRLPRAKGHHANKWVNNSHVTEPASSRLRSFLESIPGFASALLGGGPTHQVVVGNKLDWVAKNYKTDRTIAIEPDWNMFLQKGIGKLVRRRLKRVGIDLNDQTVNQILAFIGSVDGSLATVDLSMASDCVAYRLAEFLIRPDWFEPLTEVRSPIGFYKALDGSDEAVVYEKLSSMGNGYTFEIESLIFWGIGRAVSDLMESADHRLFVYGDDLVMPTGIASEVCRILGQVGFSVNESKTFTQGPFRESCGAFWFEGDDVKPFYVREAVDSVDRLFLLHNNVARWFQRHEGICESYLIEDLLQWIRSHAPRKWRKPSILNLESGDAGFYGSFTQVRPRKPGRKNYGWDGWFTGVLLHRSTYETPRPAVRRLDGLDGGREDPRIHWPMLTHPEFSSLWNLEKRDPRCTVWEKIPFNIPCPWGPDVIESLKRLQSTDGREVPYPERFWYEGNCFTPSHLVTSVWWT